MNDEQAFGVSYEFTGKYDTRERKIHKYIEAVKYSMEHNTFDDYWHIFYYAKILSYYGKYNESEKMYLKILSLEDCLDEQYKVKVNAHLELGKLYLTNKIKNKHNKAYLHFLTASHLGHLIGDNDGALYLALMYKEGKGVIKNYEQYKSIIVNRQYKKNETLFVIIELAKFFYEEGDINKCKKWLNKIGKYVDLSIYDIFEIDEPLHLGLELKRLQYKLKLINRENIDLYCVDVLKDKYNQFNIEYDNKLYLLEYDRNTKTFRFNSQNYRDYKEFLLKSRICGIELVNLVDELKIYV